MTNWSSRECRQCPFDRKHQNYKWVSGWHKSNENKTGKIVLSPSMMSLQLRLCVHNWESYFASCFSQSYTALFTGSLCCFLHTLPLYYVLLARCSQRRTQSIRSNTTWYVLRLKLSEKKYVIPFIERSLHHSRPNMEAQDDDGSGGVGAEKVVKLFVS